MSLIKINLERIIISHTLDNVIYYCKIILDNIELFSKEEMIKTKNIYNYFNNLYENFAIISLYQKSNHS